MTKLVKDPKALYNREDCTHFVWRTEDTCCGRRQPAGRCTLGHSHPGPEKPCFTALDHCKYTLKEEIVVNG